MTHKLCFLIQVTVLLGAICVFSTSGFSAGTPEQRRACKDDAFRLCREVIPDVPKITACMHKNRAKLSPPCKAHFKDS